MHPARKQRLFMVLALVIGSTLVVGLGGFAMRNYADFFYPVSDIVAGKAPLHKTIRAGGCVVPGTIIKATDRMHAEFVITDGFAHLKVSYAGLLPDIFDEGEAAVVTGQLGEDGVLVASRVLAKHDENYVPAEIAATMTEEQLHSAECRGIDYDKGLNYDS